MSIHPRSPCCNFVTSDLNVLSVDRRPLRLGLYLQSQTFSPTYSASGSKLLQTFKYFRKINWAGNLLFVVGAAVAIAPELSNFTQPGSQVDLVTGGISTIGAAGLKFWSKVQTDETMAKMETEFNILKELIILHNKNPSNTYNQKVVPYLVDPFTFKTSCRNINCSNKIQHNKQCSY